MSFENPAIIRLMRLSLFLTLTILGLGNAHASAPSPSPGAVNLSELGLHGGYIVHHKGRHVEVKASRTERMLHVYVPKKEGVRPKNLNVSIFHNGKLNRTVRLDAVPENQEGYYHYQAPVDEAALTPENGSAMGFGVQFDLDPKAP